MNNKIAKNIIFSAVGFAWPLALMIFTTPIVVHGLGDDWYGVWILISNILSYLTVFNAAQTAGVKYLSEFLALKDDRKVGSLIFTSFCIYLAVGILSAVGIWFGADAITSSFFKIPAQYVAESRFAFQLSAISFLFTALGWWSSSILSGLQRYDLLSVVALISATLLNAGNALLVHLGYGVTSMMVLTICSLALSFVLMVILSWRTLAGVRQYLRFDLTVFKQVLSFAAFSLLQTLFAIITFQLDKTVLGVWIGVSALPFYSIPLSLAQRVHQLCAKAMEYVTPLTSELTTQKQFDKLRYIYTRSQMINNVIVVLFAMPLFVYANSIMAVWMDPSFAEKSTTVFRILVAGYAIMASNIVSSSVAAGVGHPEVNTAFALLLGATSITGYYLFIPTYGIEGAGISNLISFFISVGVLIIFVNQKYLQVNFLRLFREAYSRPLLIGVVVGLAAWWTTGYISNMFVLLVFLALTCSTYLVGVYFFGRLAPEEKAVIHSNLQAILHLRFNGGKPWLRKLF
ncbi:MAG: oligosaccharide flippase family protein [Chloroflexi bacterium]|nr:oligosaccharide flippase family protein [Chloroflexota bacterium]